MRTSAYVAPLARAALSATSARTFLSAVGIGVAAPNSVRGNPSTGTTSVPTPTPLNCRNVRRSKANLRVRGLRRFGPAAKPTAKPRRRHAPFAPEGVGEMRVVGETEVERELRQVRRAARQSLGGEPGAQAAEIA